MMHFPLVLTKRLNKTKGLVLLGGVRFFALYISSKEQTQ